MKKLIALVAAMVMVSGYAYAADWNFYGSARVSTFYTSVDHDTVGVEDTDNFAQGLQGNSRIGANVKVSDELTGRFEYGTGVNVRILYGEWNFGSGSLLIGQTYTPLNIFYSNQVFGGDQDLLPTGGLYSGREAMLMLKFGGLDIALVPVAATDIVASGTSTTQITIPGIEARYHFKMDPFAIDLGAGYQTYEINDGASSWDVDSYVVVLGGTANLGMAYINASVWMGQNAGNMLWLDTGSANAGLASTDGLTVNDNKELGYLVVVGAKINDMFSVEAGYSKLTTELDQVGAVSIDDDSSAYYAQAQITLAPGVFITPEVGVIDYEEAGSDKVTYFGAKWQINF